MKREFIYERRQTASRMEAVMLVVTGVALIGAIFAFLRYGWLASLGLLILGSVAYGLSRVFDLIGDLFASIAKSDEGPLPRSKEGDLHET
jgi:hypothetical protein